VFLVALNVGSQIRIRMVKVFDEAESVPHGMGAWYGQVLPEPEVIKTSKVDSRIALSPKCVENHLNEFYDIKISYYCSIGKLQMRCSSIRSKILSLLMQ
jgi:hypothetical protein